MRPPILQSVLMVLMVTTYAAASPVVIDFDNDAAGNPILPGQVIDDEYVSFGVTVLTMNQQKFYSYGIAFNSNNPTGGDTDLRTGAGSGHPAMGNVLVISENDGGSGFDPATGLIIDPDDEGGKLAGYFDFFFDTEQDSGYVSLLDIEADEAGTIELYNAGLLVDTLYMLGLGDNSFQTVDFDGTPFNQIRVNMAGSGAVTELGAGQPVPEPASAILLYIGLAVLTLCRKRTFRRYFADADYEEEE